MINNVNNFAAAKVKSPQTPVTGQQYNYLIDLLSHAIKILSITSAGGVSVGATGLLELGNELEALQALSDAAGFVKKSGDAAYAIDATDYQPQDDTLTSLAALTTTAANDFIVSDGADSWAVMSSADVKTLLGVGSGGSSAWGSNYGHS